MPRNLSGVYSLPVIYEANPGETILSEQHNTPLEDVRDALNGIAPIFAGGTNGETAVEAHDNLNTKGANIASAATTDLSLATGVLVTITGAATITSFGTAVAGVERVLIFSGAATVTHNATSLILPGGANIVTAANDVAVMRSLGSGNWQCVGYQRATGLPVAGFAGASQTLTYVDAGAAVGPTLDLFRDSASAAAFDFIGKVKFSGKDSGGAVQEFASIRAQIRDATPGSEDGAIRLTAFVNGVETDLLILDGATGLIYNKGEITTGTYTPTLINGTNVAASTSSVFSYSRNGDTVTVWGQIQIDVTAASTNTGLGITLPIASDFASIGDCCGSAVSFNTAISAYGIFADTVGNTAALSGLASTSTVNITYAIHFSYRII